MFTRGHKNRIWVAMGIVVASFGFLLAVGVTKLVGRVEASAQQVEETVTQAKSSVREATDSATLNQLGTNLGVAAGAAVKAFDSIMDSDTVRTTGCAVWHYSCRASRGY